MFSESELAAQLVQTFALNAIVNQICLWTSPIKSEKAAGSRCKALSPDEQMALGAAAL